MTATCRLAQRRRLRSPARTRRARGGRPISVPSDNVQRERPLSPNCDLHRRDLQRPLNVDFVEKPLNWCLVKNRLCRRMCLDRHQMSAWQLWEAHWLATSVAGRSPSQNYSRRLSGLANRDRSENRSFSTKSVNSGCLPRANSGHCWTTRRTGQTDPKGGVRADAATVRCSAISDHSLRANSCSPLFQRLSSPPPIDDYP